MTFSSSSRTRLPTNTSDRIPSTRKQSRPVETLILYGASLIGRTLAHYQVLSALGAGGMGEGDVALEFGVGGAIDLAHAAGAEGAEDLVVG